MFGSEILDIVIGVIFVYLLLSLICSALNELVAWIFRFRANTLEDGIRQLLSDPEGSGPAKFLYEHPLIKALAQKGKKPSYIPSRTFAFALMDVVKDVASSKGINIAPVPHNGTKLDSILTTVANLPASDFKKAILGLIDETGLDIKKARKNLENWFDDSMERVSGWYKRKTQGIILIWAFIVSFGLNADTLFIAKSLSHDATLRASLIAAAQEAVKQPAPTDGQHPNKIIEEVEKKIQQLQLPIGWPLVDGDPRVPSNCKGWLAKIAGLFFTMIALSLGAPFWYDVLNKVVHLRASGKPPKEAPIKP